MALHLLPFPLMGAVLWWLGMNEYIQIVEKWTITHTHTHSVLKSKLMYTNKSKMKYSRQIHTQTHSAHAKKHFNYV